MKEHAGGSPEIVFESWEDVSYPVPITHFDYDHMDSVAARFREALADGEQSFRECLRGYCATREQTVRGKIVHDLLSLLRKSRKPGMAIDQLLWASGCFGLIDGETGPSLARKWRVSKQAFQQGADAIAKALQLRKTRTMRDDDAREKMRLRNSRRGK